MDNPNEKMDLKEYEAGLNSLLEQNGFEERFIFENNHFEGVEKLIIRHKTDLKKAIEITLENERCVLAYLFLQKPFDCGDNKEECIADIFEEVASILNNKSVVCYQTNKNGGLKNGGLLLLELDVDGFEYGKKERMFLKRFDNIHYDLWTGEATENIKLFVIGSIYTKMPAIAKKWREKQLESIPKYDQNVLWAGDPKRIGSVLFPLKICGVVYLIFTLLNCFSFFHGWRLFVFFEALIFISACVVIPKACYEMKKGCLYVVEKEKIRIVYSGAGSSVEYSYKDILSMKIKYGVGQKDKKHGTIKIKVRKRRLTWLNNNLYSIPEPQKVFDIIQAQIKEQT